MNALSPTSLVLLAGSFAAALVTAGCSSEPAGGGGAFPEQPLATVTSDHGAATIEVRTSPQPPTRGSIQVEYAVSAKGEAVDGLTIEVEPMMPDMGHGTMTMPTVAAEGDGRYLVSNVELYMAGRWELRTSMSGTITDTAVITLQIP